MGRDDNRALPGLAGGRAPARAFHDFMVRAVANRPAEAFVTEPAAPDWQIEQNEEFWFTPPDDEPLVDADGNPIEPAPPPIEDGSGRGPGGAVPGEEATRPERLDQDWLDRAIDRREPPRERTAAAPSRALDRTERK